ncbi:REPEAT-CONTAINING PROTEIN putative-RELATED [Salix koriyanagi]|uniref:REPEAT-CONTAINING PROTEIN putative-RELATED n=1 Tax=Salix koriyanagi TaxID=2511006 RepID=A0A9Q0VRB9_9ROSI|nr:REPEAT-CONTAINING PROTEIN putative-RELATED [Salix koriyanagi]
MLKAQRKAYVPFRHAPLLLRPHAVTPSSPLDPIKLLKLSADTKNLKIGKTIHAHLIVTYQATENNVIKVNSLINFYAKVNQVSIAHDLFDRMPERNVVSWSALMTGYLLNGFSLKAITLLKDMVSEANVSPNEYIYAIAISSCCDRGRLEEGRQCHGLLLKTGFSFHNYVRNALVSMYSKCSIVQDAMGVWNEVPVNDIVAYNSILSRLVENGYLREGLEVLRSMVSESLKWDKVTFVNAFSLCASLKNLRLGLHVHGKMLTSDVECDAYVSSAIINMYGKCGKSLMARGLFNGLQNRNVVLWTAVMAAYFQNGCFEEALNLFSKMEQENVKSNEFTHAVLLNACAGLSALRNGSLFTWTQ